MSAGTIIAIIVIVVVLVLWSVVGTFYHVMQSMQRSANTTLFERVLTAPAYVIYGVLFVLSKLSSKRRR